MSNRPTSTIISLKWAGSVRKQVLASMTTSQAHPKTVLYYGKIACRSCRKININSVKLAKKKLLSAVSFPCLTLAAIFCTRVWPIEPQTSILFTSMAMVSLHGAEAPCIGPNTLSGLRRFRRIRKFAEIHGDKYGSLPFAEQLVAEGVACETSRTPSSRYPFNEG